MSMEISAPLQALVIYGLWAIALVIAIAVARLQMVMSGGQDATQFPSGQPHGGDRYWRLNRAHLNTVENLPVYAAIVIAGVLSGHTDGTFATLAQAAVGFRILQSLVHISSNSAMIVNIRFASLLAQLVCLIWMSVIILS